MRMPAALSGLKPRCFPRFAGWWRDDTGSPSVEFAFAAMPLVLMVIGTMEFGMIMFTSTLMESGLRDAARFGITGQEPDGQSRLERIIDIIEDRTIGLIDMSAADVEVLVYDTFGDIGRGETFVDGNGNGQYDPGETYTDENSNGQWDDDVGAPGAGGSGQIVVYRMRYRWPLLTPLLGHVIGADGHFTLNAAVAVRNEPWET
jgi:Flp pilus assembly protein TadG